MESNWVECVVDNNYEINTSFPHQIRRKDNKRIISEWCGKNGYVLCHLNRKTYQKHCIVASQFIENDNPEAKLCVDHKNQIRNYNNVKNLRWTTYSENNFNRSSSHGYDFVYVDDIPNDSIEVLQYGKHCFVDYYYVEEEDKFYFWNGIKFRQLHICFNKCGSAFVQAYDTNGKKVRIMYAKFKREYGLV